MGRTSDARERIVRTAARLFLTRSYEAVGVNEVCAEADVRKGSFYHFFAAKTDLAVAVVDFHAAELRRRMERTAAADPAAALLAVPAVIGEIQHGFEARFGWVVGCPFGNMATELATYDEAVRERVARLFTEWEGMIARSCLRAAEAGLLRPGTDPHRLAHLLLAGAQGSILLAKVGRHPAGDIEQALRELVTVHLAEGVAHE